MKPKSLIPLLSVALAGMLPAAPLVATGTYDEQGVQTNTVDFQMAYSSNATWTTGIGQSLGAAQIRNLATFKPQVEAAFLTGNGGVISFDGVDNANYNTIQAFDVSFAGGTKQLTLRNLIDGSHSIAGPLGDRTAISGSQFLGTGGNPHFDLEFGGFTGFGPNEKITAVGLTVLGRSGQGTGRNYRVVARYTNGVDSGSSSTFRAFDMQNGNTTQDSFAGIVAPDGYWITSLRVHADSGIFTGIDDIGFVTSNVDNPDNPPSIVSDLPAALDARFNSTVNLAIVLDPATSPPPTWKWEFDAAPEDGGFVEVPVGDGGNNATLSFISGPAREGTYRVTATNSKGTVTSGACEFRVARAAPVITTNLPSSLSPVEREVVVLSVTLDPATYPAPDYQWFFNSVEIPASSGGTNPSFTFIAGPATDGLYFVDVVNSEGLAFSAGSLVEYLADADRDGIPDIDETNTGIYQSSTDTGTDPNNPDSDGDGRLDGGNIPVNSADPRHAAWAAAGISFNDDGDVRTFLGERPVGTNPNLPDTDGDGLLDGNNITLTSADPRHAAWTAAGIVFSDAGGQRTFFGEIAFGTNPLLADTDGDGIADGQEVVGGTNPNWFNDAIEWRPGGVPGGAGVWNSSLTNWFNGETPPGFVTVWDSGKTGLFPQPAGAVSVAGTQQANQLVFRHTAGTYNLNAANPGDTLAFIGADPRVRIERETRFNLPVAGSFSLIGGTNTLRLTTDNSSSLAGATVRLASGQLRGQDGDIGNGNELGGANTTIIVEPGAQIRYFNVNQGARIYLPVLRLAGTGFGNPGALNNDSNADNNVQWRGEIILDGNATIATQNAATWTFANIHDDGAGDKTLTLSQQNNTSNITGDVNLGGLLKTGNGILNFTTSAVAAPGTLSLGGGTVRLNAPGQLAPATRVVFTNAAATLDLNGHAQTVAGISGAGSVAGAAVLTATASAEAGQPGQQMNVNGGLVLAGAEWRVNADGFLANQLNVQGNLDLEGTGIRISAVGLTEDAYVIATYGSLVGTPVVTGLPAGYRLVLNHNSGTAIALVREAGGDGFAAWAAANGISGEPFDGDFDDDGIPNGMEYALAGLDPTTPGGFPGTLENGTLTFSKRPVAVENGDVTWTIETSNTLAIGSWTTVTPDINDPGTISYTLPTGEGRIFARLRVAPATP